MQVFSQRGLDLMGFIKYGMKYYTVHVHYLLPTCACIYTLTLLSCVETLTLLLCICVH